MNVTLGATIELPTKHGDFSVTHVNVVGDRDLQREGVVLHKESDGEEESTPTLVRVQSSCLFSESFWATDCDCALQLSRSLDTIGLEGGYVLYFYEEGRGAGLEAKFEAIRLQQSQGLDSVAAYECLKMKVDCRSYEVAAAVIRKLIGEKEISLLTNNPGKVDGLTAAGVKVASREPLVVGTDNPAVREYLGEKARIFGHIIDD